MNSNKLKEFRVKRGMSISELARRSKLSRIAIINIENGDSDPKAKTISAICKSLNVNPNVIFFGNVVNHEFHN